MGGEGDSHFDEKMLFTLLGNLYQMARENANVTLEDLSKQGGISVEELQAFENGDCTDHSRREEIQHILNPILDIRY